MNEPDRETIDLIHHLRKLQPARSDLQLGETFYRAGFEACRAQTRHHHVRPWSIAVAAAMLGVLITGPIGYLSGRRTAEKSATTSLATNAPIGLSAAPQDAWSADQPSPDQPSPDHSAPDHSAESEPSPLPIEAMQPASLSFSDERQVPKTLATTRLPDWMAPLGGFAQSAELNRQSKAMLSMSHTSRLLRASCLQDLSDAAVLNNDLERFAMTQSLDSSRNQTAAAMTDSMLSVKDLQTIALDGEASR